MAKKTAKKAKKAVKKAAKKVVKKTVKKKAVKKVAKKKTAKKAVVKKAVKKSAKKAVKKATAKKAVKKVAKKTAKKTVKKAAEKAVKKTAKKVVKKKVAKKKTAKEAINKTAAIKLAAKRASKAKPKAVKKAKKVKKIKTHLKAAELKEFRNMLLEKRKSIIGDMNGMQGSTHGMNMQDSAGDLSNMPTHIADIGSDNFEHEFTLELLESERQLLREIDEALERIEDKTFGVCMGTGKPISMPRLKARPWCKYGIEYKKMIEQGIIRPGQTLEDLENQED